MTPPDETEDTTAAAETPGLVITSTADTPPQGDAPTLDDAYYTLGRALLPLLADDIPAQTSVQECMGLYTDGNHAAAWQRTLAVLEQVLGAPLFQR